MTVETLAPDGPDRLQGTQVERMDRRLNAVGRRARPFGMRPQKRHSALRVAHLA